MTIPPGHRAGSIEAPLWGEANGRNDVVLMSERELDGDQFRAELASQVSGRIGVNRDILAFVHGFSTSFDEARSRATQIVADTHFGGVAVLFTWPSRSNFFGYVSDKDRPPPRATPCRRSCTTSARRRASARSRCSPIPWAAG